MKLNEEMQKKVEENLGLIHKVINDKVHAPPSTAKGIDAIILMSEVYTCGEIGEQIGATDKQVTAMVSKARKFLKERKDVLALAGNM